MGKHRIKGFAKFSTLADFTHGVVDKMASAARGISTDPTGGNAVYDQMMNNGFRRLFVLPQSNEPSSGSITQVIDDSTDYRDRTLVVFGPKATTFVGSGSAAYPGGDFDYEFNSTGDLLAAVYYTQDGLPAPGAAGNTAYLQADGGGYRLIYARDTDGALMLATFSGAVSTRESLAIQMYVSPVVTRSSVFGGVLPPDPPAFAGADFSCVLPHDLNNLQDTCHMSQTGPSPDTFALGKITEGTPPLALEYNVRGETKRQDMTTPALHRFAFYKCDANSTVLLDDRQDWRDRFVAAIGHASASDIRPGQASDALNGTTWQTVVHTANGYTGPGQADGTTALHFIPSITGSGANSFLFADEDTGYLYHSGEFDGTQRFFNLHIIASPQTGLRSQGTATTELDVPAPNIAPTGRLVDGLLDVDSDILCRYRGDRGIVNIAGRVAAVGDQSGNGVHLASFDPDFRPLLPHTVESANGHYGIDYEATSPSDVFATLDFATSNRRDTDFGIGFNGAHVYFVGTVNVDTGPIFFDAEVSDPNFEFISGYDVSGALGIGGWFFVFGPSADYTILSTAGAAGHALGEAFAMGVDVYWDGAKWVPTASIRTSSGVTNMTTFLAGSDVTEMPDQYLFMRFAQYMNGEMLECAIWDKSLGSATAAINSTYSINRYGI